VCISSLGPCELALPRKETRAHFVAYGDPMILPRYSYLLAGLLPKARLKHLGLYRAIHKARTSRKLNTIASGCTQRRVPRLSVRKCFTTS
jgi:hypothetical protein